MGTRDQYVKTMKAQLDEWNAEIDKLEARSRKLEAKAQVEYEAQIEALKDKREEARRQLDEIRNAADDSWERLKNEAEGLWKNMAVVLRKTKEGFREGLQEQT
jgi:hypothetical protein